jgi:hypothetical protein
MISCVFVLMLAASAVAAFQPASRGIAAYFKPIQVDGFLLEWREAALQRAAEVPGYGWDAANTPGGLAGYICVDSGGSCRPCRVALRRASPDTTTLLTFTLDTGGTSGLLWAVCRPENAGVVVGEFLVPWDRVNPDSNGNYLVRLLVDRVCGQAADEVVLAGNRWPPVSRIVTPRMWVQAGLVGVLAVVYLVFYLKIRKRRRQRGCPRQ